MTGDLISREALTDRSEVLYQHTDSGKIIPWSAVRVCVINNAPAVDTVPVVHGRWEHVADFGCGNCYGYCSVCKAEHQALNATALRVAYNYCRYCGAKMDEEEADG